MRVAVTILTAMLAVAMAQGQIRGYRQKLPGGQTVSSGEIREDPQKERERRRAACERRIETARQRIAAGEYGRAREALDGTARLAVDQAQADRIGKLLTEIEKEGRRQIAQAEQHYLDERYVESIEQLEYVMRICGSLPAALTAKQALAIVENDPDAQAALQEVRARGLDSLVERLLAGAAAVRRGAPNSVTAAASRPSRVSQIRRLDLDRQARAVDLLEKVATLYPDSPTGRKAAAELKALMRNEAIAAALEKHRTAEQAKAAFNRARMYQDAGMTDKAVGFYEQVIREYPGSEAAGRARTELLLLRPGNRK